MNEIDALGAARNWAERRGHQSPDDRLLRTYGDVMLTELAARLRQRANDASNAEQAKAYEWSAQVAESMRDKPW